MCKNKNRPLKKYEVNKTLENYILPIHKILWLIMRVKCNKLISKDLSKLSDHIIDCFN